MRLDINSLRAIYESVSARFFSVYESTPPSYTDYAMEVSSNAQTEIHTWLGAIPSIREWVGERVIDRLGAYEYAVDNRDWQASIQIDRNAIEDDRVGLYRPVIDMLARQARNHPGQLALQVFRDNTVGYDGRPLFATNHEEGESGVQSNVLTGTGTSLSAILNDLDLADARFASFRNDRGEPIMIGGRPLRVTHVMVPPGLYGAFQTVANAQLIANNTNRWYQQLGVILNPYLTDQNDWIALCLEHDVKPILVQIRRAPQISDFNAAVAESELFHSKRFLIGVDARYAVAPAFWQTAILVTNIGG